MVFLFDNAYSQRTNFTQLYAAPLYLSPSYTGMTDGSRVVFNYRDQWAKMSRAFVTYASSFDHYFYRIKSGIGISMVRDVAGEGNLSLTDIGLSYSYKLQVNRHWIVRPGIKFKYGQRGIDITKLTFGNQIEIGQPDKPTSNDYSNFSSSKGYIDIDASVLAYHKKYWAGITVAHLLKPSPSLNNEADVRIPMKYTVFGGTTIPIKGDRRRSMQYTESVSFSFSYQLQDLSDQVSLGAYWYKEPFTLGLWARTVPGLPREKKYTAIDAVMVLIGFEVQDLKFGYSYDYTLSRLFGVTGGSHEISIIYEFNKNIQAKRTSRRVTIPCPKF